MVHTRNGRKQDHTLTPFADERSDISENDETSEEVNKHSS